MLYLLESDTGKVHTIYDKVEWKIGRGRSNHLKLDVETVSKEHAVIKRIDSGNFILIDASSKHGTRVSFTNPPSEWSLVQHNKEIILKIGQSIHFGRLCPENQKYVTVISQDMLQKRLQEQAMSNVIADLSDKRLQADQTNRNKGSNKDRSKDIEITEDNRNVSESAVKPPQSQSTETPYQTENRQDGAVTSNNSIYPPSGSVTVTLQYGASASLTPVSVHIGPSGMGVVSAPVTDQSNGKMADMSPNTVGEPVMSKATNRTLQNTYPKSGGSNMFFKDLNFLPSELSIDATVSAVSNAVARTMPAKSRLESERRAYRGQPLTPVDEVDSVYEVRDSFFHGHGNSYENAYVPPSFDDSLDDPSKGLEYYSPPPQSEKSPETMRYKSKVSYDEQGDGEEDEERESLGSLVNQMDGQGLGSDERLEVKRVRDSHSELVREANRVLAGLTDFVTWKNNSSNFPQQDDADSAECDLELRGEAIGYENVDDNNNEDNEDDAPHVKSGHQESNETLTLLKRKHEDLLRRSGALVDQQAHDRDDKRQGTAPSGSQWSKARTIGCTELSRVASNAASGKKMRLSMNTVGPVGSAHGTAVVSKKGRSADGAPTSSLKAMEGGGASEDKEERRTMAISAPNAITKNRDGVTPNVPGDKGSRTKSVSEHSGTRGSTRGNRSEGFDRSVEHKLDMEDDYSPDLAPQSAPLRLPRTAVLERLNNVVKSLEGALDRSFQSPIAATGNAPGGGGQGAPIQDLALDRSINFTAVDSSVEKLDGLLLQQLIPEVMRRTRNRTSDGVPEPTDSEGHDDIAKEVLDLVESVDILRGLRQEQCSQEPELHSRYSNAMSNSYSGRHRGGYTGRQLRPVQGAEYSQEELSSYVAHGVEQVIKVATNVMRELADGDEEFLTTQSHLRRQVSNHSRPVEVCNSQPEPQPGPEPKIESGAKQIPSDKATPTALKSLVAEVAGDGEVRLRLLHNEEIHNDEKSSGLKEQLLDAQRQLEILQKSFNEEEEKLKKELETVRAQHAEEKLALQAAMGKIQELSEQLAATSLSSKANHDEIMLENLHMKANLQKFAAKSLHSALVRIEKKKAPLAHALRQWRSTVSAMRLETEANIQKQVLRLQRDFNHAKETIHALGCNDGQTASLIAERALNRELSATNIDLQQRLHDVYNKLLEAASIPPVERKRLVRDVLLNREDELMRCRRECRSLHEMLECLQSTETNRQNLLQGNNPNDDLSKKRKDKSLHSSRVAEADAAGRPESSVDADAEAEAQGAELFAPTTLAGQLFAEESRALFSKEKSSGNGLLSAVFPPLSSTNAKAVPPTMSLPPKIAQQVVLLELTRLQGKMKTMEADRSRLISQLVSNGKRMSEQELAIVALQQRVLDKQQREVRLESLLEQISGNSQRALLDGLLRTEEQQQEQQQQQQQRREQQLQG